MSTCGFRLDGNHYKYIGLRPRNHQTGDYQVELTIKTAIINGQNITLDTSQYHVIDKYRVSLGNVVAENYGGWHRQMIEVPNSISTVNDFKIQYDLLLKGYTITDDATLKVLRPTCSFH